MVFLYTLIAISFLSILSLVPFLWCSSSKRSISLIVTIFMMITMMMTTMTMMIISIIMIYILMKSPTPYLLREMGCLDHWLNELLIDLVPQRSPCHTNYCQSVKTCFSSKRREPPWLEITSSLISYKLRWVEPSATSVVFCPASILTPAGDSVFQTSKLLYCWSKIWSGSGWFGWHRWFGWWLLIWKCWSPIPTANANNCSWWLGPPGDLVGLRCCFDPTAISQRATEQPNPIQSIVEIMRKTSDYLFWLNLTRPLQNFPFPYMLVQEEQSRSSKVREGMSDQKFPIYRHCLN